MYVEQIYTGCLSQGAYYIMSDGEAAIIDPLREIKPYLERAAKDNVPIKYIFETHFHADFVSGHLDLANATGATIVYGPTAAPAFDAYVGKDGEQFPLGNITIELLHTPGHTLESSCFLLMDEENKPHSVFTGDTLFVGDVGRPDLAQEAAHMTSEQLAGLLYTSLREKVMTLPDEVIVYPAHGAGSACGKNMARETASTIGEQKKSNYALRADMKKEEFVKEVMAGLLPPPVYFPENARMNREGYESIDEVLKRGLHPLPPSDFEAAANNTGALVLDTRHQLVFVKGFIPTSINISLEGNFAQWVGALIPDIRHSILIVAEKGTEEEIVTRLARVGYDNVLGYLEGSFAAWGESGREIETIESIPNVDFAKRYLAGELHVVDVRRPDEYDEAHLDNAVNLPLDRINDTMKEYNATDPVYLHCARGHRSVIAASILKARGIQNVINIEGGFTAMVRDGLLDKNIKPGKQ